MNNPITGEPLDPTEPPTFLLDKPALSDGYYALKFALPRTALDILCTVGEERAEDLGDGQFEDLVLDPRNGIQVIGHTVDGAARSGDDMLTLSGAGSSYVRRIQQVAEPGGIPVFSAGLEVTLDGEPAGEVERALRAIGDVAATHALEPDAGEVDLAVVRAIARDLHQWYRVLRTGERLQYHAALMEETGVALETALLLTPVADAASQDKFIALGRDDTEQEAVDPDSYTEDMQLASAIMRQGYIDIDPWRGPAND